MQKFSGTPVKQSYDTQNTPWPTFVELVQFAMLVNQHGWLVKTLNTVLIDNSNSRVVRASAFGAVDSGLVPSQVKPMAVKLVFKAFPCLTLSIDGAVRRTNRQVTCCFIWKDF